jgi:hypothetical protein
MGNEDLQKDLSEQDIENFLENDNANQGDDNDESTLTSLKPQLGMQFSTRQEAHNFFNLYAYAARFSIAIVSAYRTTSRKRKNEITRVTIKCNKFRHNTEAEKDTLVCQRQSKVIAKTDCKTEMIIHERDGVCIIKSLCLEHNHPLDP